MKMVSNDTYEDLPVWDSFNRTTLLKFLYCM